MTVMCILSTVGRLVVNCFHQDILQVNLFFSLLPVEKNNTAQVRLWNLQIAPIRQHPDGNPGARGEQGTHSNGEGNLELPPWLLGVTGSRE